MEQQDGTLIGLDWGTSRVRAYLFDERGRVVAERAQPWGVLAAPEADFPAAFDELTAEWRTAAPGAPVIACGMIGSTEGWLPAPYCACPAGPAQLAASLVRADVAGGSIRIVPGVEQRGDVAEVMRGEETQVAGVLALQPECADASTLILPGTHSKWVDVRDGSIVRFATYMTGELFAVLREHSILGRPARRARLAGGGAAPASWDAFDRGVALAQTRRGLAPVLFQTRSLVLAQRLAAEDSLDFLSGLLVGDEIASSGPAAPAAVVLIGDAAICARYERALAAFGTSATLANGAAPAGLWDVACRAGLVPAVSHV